MQPVQYRGYAQGTAFNPIILSDQSRKILEQNEQFLRGLQEKQRIERNFEVAKLKQLQQNMQSQRDQLNENYSYDERQRGRYNQSLQENSAREIRDLKRIAALEPDKPSTAKVVNDVADFFISLSNTAAKTMGAVRQARVEQDQKLADEVSSYGSELSDAYIGMQVGGKVIYDTANNNIVATFASAQSFKESGYVLQQGQKLFDIDRGVQANLSFVQVQNKLRNLPGEFEAQSEYEYNGQKIDRGQFMQLSAAEKKDIFNQKQEALLAEYQATQNPGTEFQNILREKLTAQSNKYYGENLKLQADINTGKAVELYRSKFLLERTPESFQNYVNIEAIANGGDRAKASNAGFEKLFSTEAFSGDEVEAIFNSSFPDQPGQTIRFRNATSVAEVYKNRSKDQLAVEQRYENKRELLDKQTVRLFHESFDKDRSDGTIDDATPAQLAEQASKFEAQGLTEAASTLRSNIKLTADYQLLEDQRKRLNALHADGSLSPEDVRISGLEGQEFVDMMAKANENKAVVAPTAENLAAADSTIVSLLKSRLQVNYQYEGEMGEGYINGKRRELARYDTAYRNEMRSSGDHAKAHAAGIGAVKAVIGTDSSQGLYRVPANIDALSKEYAEAGKIVDFIDPSLKYAPIDKQSNTITDFRKRVDDLGMDAIQSVVTPKRLSTTFNNYRETGRITRDPSLEVVQKLLKIPYVEAHNYAAEQLGDESLKLPDELYKPATELETAARGTSIAKFLDAQAELQKEVTSDLVAIELSGQTWADRSTYSAAAQVATGNNEIQYIIEDQIPLANSLLDYMITDKQMSRNHALGLLINQIRESSLKFGDDSEDKDIDGRMAGGSFRWNGPRLKSMKKTLGDNWTDPKAQIDYALIEPGEPGPEYLNTTFNSPLDAAYWWMDKWERPFDMVRDHGKHKIIFEQLQRLIN